MVVPANACPTNDVRFFLSLQVGARVLFRHPASAVSASLTVGQIWDKVVSCSGPRPCHLLEFVAGLKACRGGRVLLDLGNGLQDVHVGMRLGQLAVRGNENVSLVLFAERSGAAAGALQAGMEKRSVKQLETIKECDLESTDCECEGESSESDSERSSLGEAECLWFSNGTTMTWRL